MKNVMIDLETLGTLPGSVVLSIGAVMFDPSKEPGKCLGEELYVVINRGSCEAAGLHTSKSTIEWWSKQSAEARKVLDESEATDTTLTDALRRLSRFIPEGARVWSNGANFDQPLLDVAYDQVGLPLPWKYWNSRCYRTVLGMYPREKEIRPATVLAHNALEDAKWQAKHMVNVAMLAGLKL